MTQGDGGDPKRLIDDSGMPRASNWAVDLLRSASPYAPPPGRRQRVREALAGKSPRRAPVWLRTAVVAAVLVAGGVASAALGHWPGWLARAYRTLVAPTAAVDTGAPSAARARTQRAAAPVAAAPVPAPPIPVPADEARVAAPAPVFAIPPRASVPAARVAAPAPRAATPAARAAAPAPRAPGQAMPAAHEDTLVLDAMRALRVQRNPVRARALLAKYLGRHPNGELAEEALALSIEAAVAHQDADAATLAARYLSQYPSGPFRGLAQKTLSQR